tara:strand:- start:948 stop:1535 length:588 start_codon:yes stop_codon:yes gene_type:complete
MIRIAVLGDIGSGKSFISKLFGFPVFNADFEVSKLYRKSRKCYNKLKKKLPQYILSFPIKKAEISNAILAKKNNLNKIIRIIHPEVRKKMKIFINNNKKSKFVVLDVPLFIESKMNKKNDILVFIKAEKKEILKRLKKRNNINIKLLKKLRNLQLPVESKRKKSHFIIKNDFKNKSVKKNVKMILKKILHARSYT